MGGESAERNKFGGSSKDYDGEFNEVVWIERGGRSLGRVECCGYSRGAVDKIKGDNSSQA